MNRVAITYRSKVAELEKLNARLERAKATYQKRLTAAEKLGVAEMTTEEHIEWMKTLETENGFLVNKADIKKNGAWFDLIGAEREVEDIEWRIEVAEKNFNKAQEELEEYNRQVEEITDLKQKEELFRLEFEEEQKEWAKDGIKLTARYIGYTPNGKRFWVERNHGFTERSWHCFTLTMTDDEGNANTVFTSGEFWRAYAIIKKN